jgi:twitching motility protein PilT
MSAHKIEDLLWTALDLGASDLHIVVGCPPRARVLGRLEALADDIIDQRQADELVTSLMTPEQKTQLDRDRELDFAFALLGAARFRVNACYERDALTAVLRAIPGSPPSLADLGLPPIVERVTDLPRGLVIVTGPAGSGKTTTLAAMIDHINRTRPARIVTIEDPIEYLHASRMATITQREIGRDSHSFGGALRSALRQDPDAILIGEMRDLETVALALTAAETGQLVFATMHTISAAESINRIVDIFPPDQQEQIRTQLTGVLEAVFTQMLVPRSDGKGRVCAMEVLVGTAAVRNLIREKKIPHIASIMQTSSNIGMQTMDRALADLVLADTVALEAAIAKSSHPEELRRLLQERVARPMSVAR